MSPKSLASWAAIVVTSLGLHVVIIGRLEGVHLARASAAPEPSFIDLAPPAPAPPLPAPPPPSAAPRAPAQAALPAKVATRRASPRPAPTTPVVPPMETPPPAPPAEEAPADFTGTTLTSEGPGAAWASATGNGQGMDGPVGRPSGGSGRGTTPPPRAPAAAPSGPRVVATGDLSRLPAPPALDVALERNYPAAARRAGRNGQAVVRARVASNGRIREPRVLSESFPGFGAACVATLAPSQWTAPLDRDGHAVSTYIQYTCAFEVR